MFFNMRVGGKYLVRLKMGLVKLGCMLETPLSGAISRKVFPEDRIQRNSRTVVSGTVNSCCFTDYCLTVKLSSVLWTESPETIRRGPAIGGIRDSPKLHNLT